MMNTLCKDIQKIENIYYKVNCLLIQGDIQSISHVIQHFSVHCHNKDMERKYLIGATLFESHADIPKVG